MSRLRKIKETVSGKSSTDKAYLHTRLTSGQRNFQINNQIVHSIPFVPRSWISDRNQTGSTLKKTPIVLLMFWKVGFTRALHPRRLHV
ncbi:hypothetical protein CEXT_652891 [Caerostris extrusa]|uniref:Uncharacterized protein n=1 Tax=Caerostris extrusa TaxID=172846 RepID=A0AAV4XTB7_CAEEX|nr:hypothetical protein CEXT_652891 [Caerostris extrusa]